MKLSDAEIERYARQIILRGVGGPGQQKLKAARVLVVGAGGLGSPALQYLAGAGVGEIAVVDDDVVSLSNLHRQILHGTPDLDRRKVDSAAEALAPAQPACAGRDERRRGSTRATPASSCAATTSRSTAPTISPPATRCPTPASTRA